ncbi:MAG: xanthine dehydrogenase family protein molybdopterin-binding subunit [Deltaproteobacteria bacterium]|nr:xanthine dehydrogenase family protein molybdopterin-binding subunit [Deltaproteobacteria bacterium]MBW2043362.1 xanthine dehydrogenase family protein molybdopterin-binding subunit [Deltaproteobacteria bacterium]MBW2299346.1 xanthine dehydrogenase family protein molybdopterin-binding subunit [Deltaproteobacteria bacterium]
MSEYLYVGKSTPRTIETDKVTGRAVYISDLRRPGMLFGKILYSRYAHAKIKGIDTSKAEKLQGVRAVLTGRDIPEVRVGFLKDQTVLKKDVVRQFRDEVAAVAATSPEIAEEALGLIEVEYEELPAVFDPIEAMKEDAPLVHEIDARGRPVRSNILPLPWKFSAGDIEQGRKDSAYIAKDNVRTTWVNQCCMGTSGCVAEFDMNNNLTLYSQTNVPFLGKQRIVEYLRNIGLKGSRVRVVNPIVGGSFGTKLDTDIYEFIAVQLALRTRKPVKILFTREEEFRALPPRQPAIFEIEQGCDKEGKLTFRKVEAILDNGAYTSWGATTPSVMMMPISSLYRVPNVSFNATCVYTNNIYCQAMRGYGNPQATFAVETSMDSLAEEAGIDPAELRLINCNKPGELTPMRLKITTCPLDRCIKTVQEKINWKEKRGKRNGRGIGMASLIHVAGGARVYKSDGHGIMVKVDQNGNVDVLESGTDQGQGSPTVISQMVAEALGFRPEDVSITLGDTALCLWDAGTHASRHTFMAGNAAIRACDKAKKQILEMAVEHMPEIVEYKLKRKERKDPDFQMPDLDYSLISEPDKLDIKDRYIFPKNQPEHPYFRMEVSEVLTRGLHVGTGESKVVVGEAFYDPPTEMLDREMKGNYSCTYAFGTTAVEVEVDRETGEVKILNLFAAHDVGRAMNPTLVKGQIYGAAYMGVGYGLTEQLQLRNGRVMNPNFRDYKMLTAKDVVPVVPLVIEEPDADGPFGAKGIGEPGLVPTAPAIANAIYDAIGVRITDLPITAEKVLVALKKKAGEQS